MQSMKWQALELGGGEVQVAEGGGMSLQLPAIHHGYADAQIDDTQGRKRREFLWSPPLQFQVEARATPGEPLGTLGFGFWNDPFSFSLGQQGTTRKLPTPPQAIWFFYGSPPNDIQLTRDGRGNGWKAMSLCFPRFPNLLALPLALTGAGLAQIRLFRAAIMRAAQGVVQSSEAQLPHSLAEWHSYSITWDTSCARFFVDGEETLTAINPPNGPLGFVAWIDNQYAIASREGGLSFGILPTSKAQTLELRKLVLERS